MNALSRTVSQPSGGPAVPAGRPGRAATRSRAIRVALASEQPPTLDVNPHHNVASAIESAGGFVSLRVPAGAEHAAGPPASSDVALTARGTTGINPVARCAFTLVELLVVITILLVLSTVVFAVFNVNGSSNRLRSAARIGQSAFLGAADRARHAKAPRGVRLIRDINDPTLVTGFTYLTPIDDRIYGTGGSAGGSGTIQVLRPDANNDGQGTDATSPDATLIAGTGVDWLSLDSQGVFPYPATRIRIPAKTGAWYTLQPQSASPPYFVTTRGSTQLLTLSTPFASPESAYPTVIAVDSTSSNASCEIELGNELMPFHQPISLPAATVIDIDNSSPNVAANWPVVSNLPTKIDIMFSARGMITGPLSALGPIHFLLNDTIDASRNLNPIDPANRGDKLILTLYPQTGLVATFPIDPTDAINNQTGQPGSDGIADDLFRFAKQGSTAGQ